MTKLSFRLAGGSTPVKYKVDKNNYKCIQCKDIVQPPVNQFQCGHRMCVQCYNDILETSTECPGSDPCCRETNLASISDVIPDNAVERDLEKLFAECEFKFNGCTAVVPLGEIREHEESCVYNGDNQVETDSSEDDDSDEENDDELYDVDCEESEEANQDEEEEEFHEPMEPLTEGRHEVEEDQGLLVEKATDEDFFIENNDDTSDIVPVMEAEIAEMYQCCVIGGAAGFYVVSCRHVSSMCVPCIGVNTDDSEDCMVDVSSVSKITAKRIREELRHIGDEFNSTGFGSDSKKGVITCSFADVLEHQFFVDSLTTPGYVWKQLTLAVKAMIDEDKGTLILWRQKCKSSAAKEMVFVAVMQDDFGWRILKGTAIK